jgi:hypothetical protein
MDLVPDPTWTFLWPLEKSRVCCKVRTGSKHSLKIIILNFFLNVFNLDNL